MSQADDTSITVGSENVFADLQVENPEDALAKAKLAHTISSIITRRHLTQAQAAAILGIDQPKVSALMRGRLTGFSIERLLRFLMALDNDVHILIRPKARTNVHGRLNVIGTSTHGVPKPGRAAVGKHD